MKNERNIDFRVTTTSRCTQSGVEMNRREQYQLFHRGLGGFSSFTNFEMTSTAQFMQADNFIQTPEDFIGYNRYAYCRYNPFKYTDPSGEMWTDGDPLNGVEPIARIMHDRGVPDRGFFAYNPATISPNACETEEEARQGEIESAFSLFGFLTSGVGGSGGKSKEKSDSKSDTETGNVSNSKKGDKSSKGKGKDDGGKSFWSILKKVFLSGLPVAVDLEANVSLLWVAGTSINPIGGILILQGDDAFKVRGYSAGGAGAGILVGAGAMVSSMSYYYYGDLKNFDRRTFNGWSDNATLSFGEGLGGAVFVAWLKDDHGGYLIGVGTGAGGSVSATAFSFQWNHQYSNIWGK
jgi:hypothetical protein